MNSSRAARVSALAGICLVLMIFWTSLGELSAAVAFWPSGLFAWLAGSLLLWRLSKMQILQLGALAFVGMAALAGGLLLGFSPPWLRLLDTNSALLSMLAAVSFLRLIAIQIGQDSAAPRRGMSAFGQTLLAVALFGGFINISAPILIADRLASKGSLSPFAAQSITRVFTGAAAWSPFFAGMAVVLTYIGTASFTFIFLVGLPFAALGLLLVLLEARLRYPDTLARFEGYPMTISNLWLPAVLAISVAAGHALLPQVSILVIISLSSLLVCFGGLTVLSGPRRALQGMGDHILHGLPHMASELLLFLTAGLLSVGLQTLVKATHLSLPLLAEFDGTAASLLLALMVVLSAAGIHPIISIAVLTPLLTPIEPDPQLLAITYVFAWSLGTCASPLSGINLIIQGRYGISSVKAAMRNWSFVMVMMFFASGFLHLVAILRTI